MPCRISSASRGTIRATVLIETILAALEMEEILYEIREHSGRSQRRALGLHLQRDQKIRQAPRADPARPCAGNDDRTLYAGLHRTACAHLPHPRRPRESAAWLPFSFPTAATPW